MSNTPQDLCEKFVNLAKDRNGLLVAFSRIGEKERESIYKNLNLIEQNNIPTAKKSKDQKEVQRASNEDIINELKTNIKQNLNDGQIITYSPTNILEIDKIEKLDVNKDIKVIKQLHFKVHNNEVKANTFPLYEAYVKGKIYYNCKLQLPINKEFLDYCKASFNVGMSYVYHYLNVYYLYEEFPSILLCGFGVTKLYKNRALIINSANNDKDLKELLTTPFPGVSTRNIEIDDPNINENDLMDFKDINMKE